MRKITREAVEALLLGRNYRKSNTEVKDRKMYLYGNKIAWITDNGSLYITNCGYRTLTTKERLNGLPSVYIKQKDWRWYLSGKYWDGSPIKICNLSSLI